MKYTVWLYSHGAIMGMFQDCTEFSRGIDSTINFRLANGRFMKSNLDWTVESYEKGEVCN